MDIKEEQIKEVLEDVVCVDNIYEEEIVRDSVGRIIIYDGYLEIFYEYNYKIQYYI